MKIAFLTPEYPHPKSSHSGGLGSSIRNLVIALQQRGHQILIVIYGQETDEVFLHQGITIHLIKLRPYTIFGGYRYRKFVQHYLNRLIDAEKVDIIEAPDWTGATAFMKLNAPLVIRFHGSDAYFCRLENRKQKLKNFLLELIATKSADAFVAPTDFAAKLSMEIFGINKNQVVTIPNGLPISEFHNPTPEVYENGLIVYIGTIIRKKGVLELPAIFKEVSDRYPGAHLLLIGADSNDIQTESSSTWTLLQSQLDSKLLSKVQYAGSIPYQQVMELIKRAHACVFPTFAETLGMVTIEAMAMQKAVITSNFGWCKEIIEDGKSGFLVNPTDHKAFADKVVDVLTDDRLRSNIGHEARKRVEEKYDIEKITEQNIAFYLNLIKR